MSEGGLRDDLTGFPAYDAPVTLMAPAFTINLYEPDTRGLWTGEIINCLGKCLASASAPDFGGVWAMLEAAIMREVGE